jgi:hypothetical protein
MRFPLLQVWVPAHLTQLHKAGKREREREREREIDFPSAISAAAAADPDPSHQSISESSWHLNWSLSPILDPNRPPPSRGIDKET